MFLKKFIRNRFNIVGGDIAYHNLTDWWLNEFTENERNIIRNTYKPYGAGEDFIIDQGNIIKSSASLSHFLCFLVGSFTTFENFSIGKRILNKAESIIDYSNEDDVLNLHFAYHYGISLYYSNRDKIENALAGAIEYCQKQIALSKKIKNIYIKKQDFLPTHVGYKQLAIIYEKQGNLLEALSITEQALSEGWNEDSQRRIDRLKKKINK